MLGVSAELGDRRRWRRTSHVVCRDEPIRSELGPDNPSCSVSVPASCACRLMAAHHNSSSRPLTANKCTARSSCRTGPRCCSARDPKHGTATRWDQAQVVAQSLTSRQRTLLVDGGSDARYLPTGHLVYALRDGLFGVASNAIRLTVTGGWVPLLQGVNGGVCKCRRGLFPACPIGAHWCTSP